MTTKSMCLLDEVAAYMECQYLSDLHFLSPYQRCVLATHLERHEAERHALFEWNDALKYLSGLDAETLHLRPEISYSSPYEEYKRKGGLSSFQTVNSDPL